MTWEQRILLLREAEGLDSRLGDAWCTFPPLLRTVRRPGRVMGALVMNADSSG